jgi:hypothetical protein
MLCKKVSGEREWGIGNKKVSRKQELFKVLLFPNPYLLPHTRFDNPKLLKGNKYWLN